MKITKARIAASPAQGSCFVHARAAFCEGGFSLITTQPLRLSGSDVFYGLHLLKSFDGGKTWGKPEPSRSIVRKPFGEKAELPAVNMITPKQFKLDTPSVSIRVDPDHSDLIETRMIDGKYYILVLADGEVEVNGMKLTK